jgi:hypothetical protein
VPTRAVTWRSIATFAGLATVAYGIAVFAGVLRITQSTGCTWPADSGEDLPPCPAGAVPAVYLGLLAGVAGLIAYLRWGFRVGPRPVFLIWPAFHVWWVVPALLGHLRESAWGMILLGSAEAVLFLLGPLAFLCFKDIRRNTFWSDGDDFFPDKENPPAPLPPADPRLKLWSLTIQVAAVGAGVTAGLLVLAWLPEMVTNR